MGLFCLSYIRCNNTFKYEEIMSDIVEMPPQITMIVSEFSGIAQRLNFLAQSIRDEEEAKKALLYIECFKRDEPKTGKKLNIIRFSTDLDVWTEIHPFNKYDGDILDMSIAVNLFDFFNIVDNCKDDLIHFTIDVSDDGEPELVISSFYNADKDVNELEVTMNVEQIGFPDRNLSIDGNEDDKEITFELSNVTVYNIISELNVEQNTEGVNIIVDGGKIKFQSNYGSYVSEIKMKEHDEQIFEKDFKVYIPFYVFNLMSATGHIGNLRFDVYNDLIILNTEDYSFSYKREELSKEVYDFPDDYNEHFVVESEEMESIVSLLNRINKPSDISLFKLEKLDSHHMDVQAQCKGRYNASAIVAMAVLSDESLVCDGDILQDLFTRSNVDAIKVSSKDTNKYIANYENAILYKKVHYKHDEFMNYRNQKFEEWKAKKES